MQVSISVLMAVYNGEKYLRDSIDSILSQNFKDFEFIIINDASTDESVNIINEYQDSRIRLIHNQKNIGLTKTLNKGLKLARGKYIARLDADDISLKNRLKIQYEFMEANPHIGLCGSWIRVFGRQNKTHRFPTEYNDLKCSFMFQNSIPHSTAFLRKGYFDKYNLQYNEKLLRSQDYDLWSRTLFLFPVANIAKVLVLQRLHDTQVGVIHGNNQRQVADTVRKNLFKKIGIEVTDKEYTLHKSCITYDVDLTPDYFDSIEKWFDKIVKQCVKSEYCSIDAVISNVLVKWYYLCMFAAKAGIWVWHKYNDFSLNELYKISVISTVQKIKLLLKCLVKR